MKIVVTDRMTLEAGLVVRSSYAVVSITDPDRPRAAVPRTTGCREVLRLRFFDAEPASREGEPLAVMTHDDAEQLAALVRRCRGQVGALVVHCEAGMSRSPAVAAAVAEFLGQPWTWYFHRYAPNGHVLDLVRRALGLAERSAADRGVAMRASLPNEDEAQGEDAGWGESLLDEDEWW